MASEPSGFEQTFREMFRRHAAGVAIITANLNGKPFGFTATSVASLSAEPPRFTFNMARSSSSWPAVANAEYIGVHMLGLENQALADIAAGSFRKTGSMFFGDKSAETVYTAWNLKWGAGGAVVIGAIMFISGLVATIRVL